MRALWTRIIAWEGGSSLECASAAHERAASMRVGKTVGGGCVSWGYFVRIVGELVTAVSRFRRCRDRLVSLRRRQSIVTREDSEDPLGGVTGPNCSRRWAIRRNNDPPDMVFIHHGTVALIVERLKISEMAVDP